MIHVIIRFAKFSDKTFPVPHRFSVQDLEFVDGWVVLRNGWEAHMTNFQNSESTVTKFDHERRYSAASIESITWKEDDSDDFSAPDTVVKKARIDWDKA